jgi:hypothetical protein
VYRVGSGIDVVELAVDERVPCRYGVGPDLPAGFFGGGGVVVVETDADAMKGWRIDRDGTLGPVHLAMNASVGWSF